jgi:hypothetical protein
MHLGNLTRASNCFHNVLNLLKYSAIGVPLPDVKGAFAIISSEESHRVVVSGSSSGTSQRAQSSVFFSNVGNKGNFQRSQTSGNPSRPSSGFRPNENRRAAGGSSIVCEHCGFNGHSIDRCFKLIGYPADFGKKKNGQNSKGKNVANNSVGTSLSSAFTDEQMATLISLIKENSISGNGVQANMQVLFITLAECLIRTLIDFFALIVNCILILYLRVSLLILVQIST